MNTIRTHAGFVMTRPPAVAGNLEFYGNPKLDALYAELINKPDLTKTWEWRKNALGVIIDTFALTPNFFRTQLQSGLPVSARCVDFLHSTLTFILTGKRKLSVILWDDLLDYHPTDLVAVGAGTRDHFEDTFGRLMTYPLAELIVMWVSHPGGLEDLVVTAYLLFGHLPENWQDQ